jgi:hypothetical protein
MGKEFWLAGPGGILAQPSVGAWRRGRMGTGGPQGGGMAWTDAVSVGPRAGERGSVDGVRWSNGGGPAEVDRRRGSAAVLRHGSGFGWLGRWLSMSRGRGSWWWGQFGRRTLGMAGPRRGGGLPWRRGRRRDDDVELDWVQGKKMEWLRPGAGK